jgi:hypothetical protein
MACWAGKTRIGGKHRTEVTEVTEGGLEVRRRNAPGGQHGFWAGKTRIGESIAQRSWRSQRGDWRFDGATLLVDSMASGREKPASGESIAQRSWRSQRGDWRWERYPRYGQHGLCRETTRKRESIALRSQRGELRAGENIHAMDNMACWRETTRKRESIAQRSQRGGIEVGEIPMLRTSSLAGEKRRERGEAFHGQALAIDQPLNTIFKACFTEID